VEPGHADSIGLLESCRVRARPFHEADYLMTGDQWKLGQRQIAFNGMKVGVTHAAREHPQQDFSGTGFRNGNIAGAERPLFNGARGVQHHGFHGETLQ